MYHIFKLFLLFQLLILATTTKKCYQCYEPELDKNCSNKTKQIITLHISIQPILDTFQQYSLRQYYHVIQKNTQMLNYFDKKQYSSLKRIFQSSLRVLAKSNKYKQRVNRESQRGRRSFYINQLWHFKQWFTHLHPDKQNIVHELIKQNYWQVLGGGLVSPDEFCTYYEDMIENYELGLNFLYKQFNYVPKIGNLVNQFGVSITHVAILRQAGIQGVIVERLGEQFVKEGKMEIIWQAKSSNNVVYGVLPVQIKVPNRDTFQTLLVDSVEQQPLCKLKQQQIDKIREQNKQIRRITKNKDHIFRTFGNKFQQFGQREYEVIQAIMQQISKQKCQKVIGMYTNPTEYFKIKRDQLSSKNIQILYQQDNFIKPWNSNQSRFLSQYVTGNHKLRKFVRNCGRLLQAVRKAVFINFVQKSEAISSMKQHELLEQFAQTVAILQHHTSSSNPKNPLILSSYISKAQALATSIQSLILTQMFQQYYTLYSNNPKLICGIFKECVVPHDVVGNLYIKVFNSGGRIQGLPIIIKLPINTFYHTDHQHQILCSCYLLPCRCQLYIYAKISTYTEILLKKLAYLPKIYLMKNIYSQSQYFSFNDTHIILKNSYGEVCIGYLQLGVLDKGIYGGNLEKQMEEEREVGGKKYHDQRNIQNNKQMSYEENITQFSKISKISKIRSKKIIKYLIEWQHTGMQTVIQTLDKFKKTWKIETIFNPKHQPNQNIYLDLTTKIKNNATFYYDTNGWLVSKSMAIRLQQGKSGENDNKNKINSNSYPMNAFVFIQDNISRFSVNTDRPQGVACIGDGRVMIHINNGKSTDNKIFSRSESPHYFHYLTLSSSSSKSPQKSAHRILQQLYDQPQILQLNQLQPSLRIKHQQQDIQYRDKWAKLSGIQNIKFWIRWWNDSSVVLRIQNIYDDVGVGVGVKSGLMSPLLTMYFGNQVNFTEIKEMSLGGNVQYEEFLRNKWNWKINGKSISQTDMTIDKTFTQMLQLRPLQIRTFKIKGIQMVQCIKPQQIQFQNKRSEYIFDIDKSGTLRSTQIQKIQMDIKDYLLNYEHCDSFSPVLGEADVRNLDIDFQGIQKILEEDDVQDIQEIIPNVQEQHHQDQLSKPQQPLQQPVQQQQQISVNSKQFRIIEQKIQNQRLLTSNQKQIYFNYKKKQYLTFKKNIQSIGSYH